LSALKFQPTESRSVGRQIAVCSINVMTPATVSSFSENKTNDNFYSLCMQQRERQKKVSAQEREERDDFFGAIGLGSLSAYAQICAQLTTTRGVNIRDSIGEIDRQTRQSLL
jgi:hypothetical protein